MDARLARKNTVVRWTENKKTREKRIPAGVCPETYLNDFIKKNAKKPLTGFYEILASELENFDRIKTARAYRCAIQIASEHNPGGEWTKAKAAKFARELSAKGYSSASVNTYIAGLRSLWDWAATNEKLSGDNPFRCKYKIEKTEPTRFEPLTNEQLTAIKKELENDPEALNLVLIVEFALIRPGELEKLNESHFDRENKLITVPAAVAKNRKTRRVNYPDSLDLRPLSEPLRTLRARVHEAFNRVGASAASSLYSVKHTSAARLLSVSCLETVKIQAGHLSVKSTEKYTDRNQKPGVRTVIKVGW